MKSAVTKNTSEKSINNILDYVGGEGKVSSNWYSETRRRLNLCFWFQHAAKAPKVSLETLEAFYSATMDALQEAKNDVSFFSSLYPCVFAISGIRAHLILPPSQRLSVKCNLKLAKLWLERKEYVRLKSVSYLHANMCHPLMAIYK